LESSLFSTLKKKGKKEKTNVNSNKIKLFEIN